LSRLSARGVLIAEAVVAAFLMVFAFAASSALFNAALQWETQSNSVRRAALLADKELEKVRAWSRAYHQTHSFSDGWVAPVTGIQASDVDSSGFEVEIVADQPFYRQNPNTGATAPRAIHSPTSHFYEPLPAVAAFPKDFANQQKNLYYQTFSYVRSFPASARRVQAIVRYGSEGDKEFRAVTVITDPMARLTPSVTFNRTQGPVSLSAASRAADYEVVVTAGGHRLEDVVCLWGVDPESTGAVIIKPMDANGRQARVIRDTWAVSGTTTRLAVRMRYRGVEYTFFSDPINIL
jgi:hypothetical protein